jgi:hypothetical protein
MRSLSVREIFAALNRKLVGYYGYYGVIGNWESLQRFYNAILRILRKWLGRRSERGRMSWHRFQALVQYHGLEPPRITELRHRQLELATC